MVRTKLALHELVVPSVGEQVALFASGHDKHLALPLIAYDPAEHAAQEPFEMKEYPATQD